jgi:hypothetical protein
MNSFNFIQTGGFPMDVNVLDQMQTAYRLYNGLGALAGDIAIIKGCTLTGSTVSDGVVYINGEVLEFRTGIVDTNVIIVQEAQSKEFENGSANEVYYTRYATFGVGTTFYPWASFKRAFPTTLIAEELEKKVNTTTLEGVVKRLGELEKKNAVFQTGGGMLFWNKAANLIPPGWREVVDWRGRMPVGFDSTQAEFNAMGKSGGSKDKTLSVNEMPSHSHTITGKLPKLQNDIDRGGGTSKFSLDDIANGSTDNAGGGQSFSIMNPYRVVIFIEYTA